MSSSSKEGYVVHPGLFACTLALIERTVEFPLESGEIKIGTRGWCIACGNQCGDVEVIYFNQKVDLSKNPEAIIGETRPVT